MTLDAKWRILQLFGGKRINRLISNDRSNSVLLSAVRSAANQQGSAAGNLVRYISEKSIINKEMTDFFEIYFTEKAEQTGIRVLNTVLDRVLAECSERAERQCGRLLLRFECPSSYPRVLHRRCQHLLSSAFRRQDGARTRREMRGCPTASVAI